MRRGGWRRRARKDLRSSTKDVAPRCAAFRCSRRSPPRAQAQSLPASRCRWARRSARRCGWRSPPAPRSPRSLALRAFRACAPRRQARRGAGRDRCALRAALDRTEALLDADDQRTIVWDSPVAAPQVFGGLPERGRRAGRQGRLPRLRELARLPRAPRSSKPPPTSSAARARASRSRVRAKSGALLEATGRTSGRRSAAAPARADRRAPLLRRAEGAGDLRHQRDDGAARRSPTCCPSRSGGATALGRLTWVNAAYVPRRRGGEPGSRARLRHRAAAVAHARGDPRGGSAPATTYQRQRHRHRRRRPPPPAGARHADRGGHDRLRHRRFRPGRRCARS